MAFSWPKKFSLKTLKNLKTLWFVECYNIFHFKEGVKFFPENLEDLCFYDCEISPELNLPELNHLRKLEIYTYWLYTTKVFVKPNTISRLSRLEELSLPAKFHIREEGVDGGSLALLDEVSELSYLKSLHIFSGVSKSTKLATIFSKLREFRLVVNEGGDDKESRRVSPLTKSIKLFSHDLIGSYQTLIDKAEEVIFCEQMLWFHSYHGVKPVKRCKI